jgi:segregation and condensation protein B
MFVSREPLSARRLSALAELEDPTEARTIARGLNEEYDREGYAFRIEEVAGGMQLLTRPQFSGWLRRLDLVPGETILSPSMLETLAIIAYRQPIPRAEIEAIRGVGSDEALRQLMQRNLIRIEGRSDELGRAYLYGTTRHFLQLFGLQSLDFLPRAQKIKQAEAETATRFSSLANVSGARSEKDGEQGMASQEKISSE